MHDAIDELKIRAEILHKKIGAESALRRRDCLGMVAAEWGFPTWLQAKAALSGDPDAVEFGTLLYPRHGPSLNRWYANYEEAVRDREICKGYLVAWKRQFLVVDRDYIESLGLDPDDPDWAEIGFDWVRPASVAARTRLYSKLVAALPRS